jgi:hypothetical protein
MQHWRSIELVRCGGEAGPLRIEDSRFRGEVQAAERCSWTAGFRRERAGYDRVLYFNGFLKFHQKSSKLEVEIICQSFSGGYTIIKENQPEYPYWGKYY